MISRDKSSKFEHVGERDHDINQNLHSITKFLIDDFFNALPKMHYSFIQPMN